MKSIIRIQPTKSVKDQQTGAFNVDGANQTIKARTEKN